MTVRLRPEETTVELIVYADISIVEGFAANGRAAITGRVYPTAKHLESNRIGCVCRVASLALLRA